MLDFMDNVSKWLDQYNEKELRAMLAFISGRAPDVLRQAARSVDNKTGRQDDDQSTD